MWMRGEVAAKDAIARLGGEAKATNPQPGKSANNPKDNERRRSAQEFAAKTLADWLADLRKHRSQHQVEGYCYDQGLRRSSAPGYAAVAVRLERQGRQRSHKRLHYAGSRRRERERHTRGRRKAYPRCSKFARHRQLPGSNDACGVWAFANSAVPELAKLKQESDYLGNSGSGLHRTRKRWLARKNRD